MRCRKCSVETMPITVRDGRYISVNAAPCWVLWPEPGNDRVPQGADGLDRKVVAGWANALQGGMYDRIGGYRCLVGDSEPGFRLRVLWLIHAEQCEAA